MNAVNCLHAVQKLQFNGHYPSRFSDVCCEVEGGVDIGVYSPIDGSQLAVFACATSQQVDAAIADAQTAFQHWRNIPAPRRGELVRRCALAFREHKQELAEIISWESGKILQEALGEVQEVIDICDFAVGLSRQLYGLTIASERPQHRMMEQWHPLGVVAVITAFNFPMAVWAWNAMIALVCGNSVVWKPSEKTPLCALACQQIMNLELAGFEEAPEDLCTVLVGDAQSGQQLAADARIALVSATGSIPMGRSVAKTVAMRLGRSLLELGGNNAAIIAPSADLSLALRAVVFAAVGTCGQRCTSLRRLIVHRSLLDSVCESLVNTYRTLPIGNPLDPSVLVGPMIDEHAFIAMQAAISAAREQGGELLCGGERIVPEGLEKASYVTPALVKVSSQTEVVMQETFAPLMYVIAYDDFDQAIALHNAVPQGLSSAIFTRDMSEAERFVSVAGSDCGIANINIATSGAEIGGAFGGEKETGGGRESGSDAWKNYMRRSTNTINYGTELPLAQGIRFDI